MKKKMLATLLAATMVFAFAACGSTGGDSGEGFGEGIDCSADSPYVMQLAHADGATDASVVNRGCEILAEIIKEKSGGAFEIKIFGNSALGTEAECIDGLGMGTVQMSIGTNPTLANLVNGLMVLDMPYMFSSQEIMSAVVKSDEIKGLYDELYEDYGMKVLATGKSGFKNIITTYGFVNNPSDLKGKKFRAIPSPIAIDVFNYLGGSGTGMAMSEVITGLQQGTIDGLDNPIATVYSAGVYTVAPYYTITNHAYNAVSFCMARSEWDKMSDEQQGWWLEAADEAVEKQIEVSEQMEADALAKMEEEGLKVSYDVDTEAMRAAVRPMYDKYRDQIGGDLLDSIVNMTKEMEEQGI